ncbi:MAG: MBL fold metallo-hydrolase [Proteobacteria bacterium]|nr:MBL fold metallo-hydrolase [Pseudomonadota bacterium]
MQITFWGVRGSYPVPGPNTVRYGGQTSCVEVRSATNQCIIVDSGTGMRELGRKLARAQMAGGPAHYHIFLSHVHWDHIQGLPFFEPAYIAGSKISVYALRNAADEIHQVISGITRHEFFYMPLDSVPADFEFHEVVPGQPIHLDNFEIRPILLNHPFGAVGYRIFADGTSWAYVSDTAPFTDVLHKQHFLPGPEELTEDDRARLNEIRSDLVAALRGTDTVVYDTHFLPEEYQQFPHWGHSTPDHALELCTGIDVRRLVLFHHAPSHTDEMMDEIAVTYRDLGAAVGLDVATAYEHLTLIIGGRAENTNVEGVPA